MLVDKSLKGWKEVEYEVVRDAYDNCITVSLGKIHFPNRFVYFLRFKDKRSPVNRLEAYVNQNFKYQGNKNTYAFIRR